jgi:glycosyltransferase involved in cell wall biosynthesis
VIESLSRSHLLAVPSSYEGFGIIYLEAMGFGLPVVASSAGGAGELLTEGREGYLIKPGDSAAVAECVGILSENRDQLLRMSLWSLERRMTFPKWAETAERIRDFLRR